MAGSTLARIYTGTIEQQDAAFLADLVGAQQAGWRPVRSERAPDSMRVTFVPIGAVEVSVSPPAAAAQPVTRQVPAQVDPPTVPPVRDRQLPPKAERPYAWRTCPYCSVEQVKLPRAKKACPDCGESILVRSGADGYMYLLSEAELPGFESTMHAFQEERDAHAAAEDRQALLAAGFLVGDDYVQVVGESHHQHELLRIVGERSEQGAHHRCAAELICEPTNQYDPDAVMVVVDGLKVGYISRDESMDVAAMVKRMHAAGRRVWVAATILGGWKDARSTGSFGVELDGLPLYE